MCVKCDMRIFLIPILIVVFSFVSPAFADAHKDISYGALEKQALDIYVPEGAKRAPVMIYVHGGAWLMGDKAHVGEKAKAFNDEGYIFVSVGYPLLPKHGLDVQAQSVADAVAWVIENIKSYGGNPKKINLMGHSSGAHLAALVATDGRYLAKAGSDVTALKRVVVVDSAALDVPSRMRWIDDEPERAQQIFRMVFGTDPTKWHDYSPTEYAEMSRKQPRFLVLIGSKDDAWDAAYNFAAKLGRKNKVVSFPRKNHRQINVEIGQEGDPIFKTIMKFID